MDFNQILILFHAFFLTHGSLLNFDKKSKCANSGRINARCTSHDFCSNELVCGDGFCGMDCPKDWISFNRNYYRAFAEHMNLSHAMNTCSQNKAKIMRARTRKYIQMIKDIFPYITRVWLSAVESDFVSSEWINGDFIWSDEEASGNRGFYVGITTNLAVIDVPSYEYEASVVCELNESCGKKAQCRCKTDYYFDSNLGRCVMHKTYKECYDHDNECNALQGLEASYDGLCLCQDGFVWNAVFKTCHNNSTTRRYYNGKLYVVEINEPFTFDVAVEKCEKENMRILSVSKNYSLREIIEPYRDYFKDHAGVWINATELVIQYQFKHDLYCGKEFSNLDNLTNWFFADLNNQKSPYCLKNTPHTSSFFTICEEK